MKQLLTSLLLSLLISVAAAATPIDYEGILSADSAAARPGEPVSVAIRLSNGNINFSAMTVPISYDPLRLNLDSVSYAGSIATDSVVPAAFVNTLDGEVQIFYNPAIYTLPLPTIKASQGVIAELFFTVAGDAPPGFLPIDSINQDSLVIIGTDTAHNWTRVSVTDSSGSNLFLPDFVAGGITVEVTTAVDDGAADLLPDEYILEQNYPNPFNPSTTIGFALPAASAVRLEVFNLLGQVVEVAARGRLPAGRHEVEFNGSALPSGVYFYRLSYGDGSITRKMVLLK
jgi:hypothetical protein